MEDKRLEEEIARLKQDAWDEVACCMEGPCERERQLMEMLKNVQNEICCCDQRLACEARKDEYQVKKAFKDIKEQERTEHIESKEKRIHDKVADKQVHSAEKAAVHS